MAGALKVWSKNADPRATQPTEWGPGDGPGTCVNQPSGHSMHVSIGEPPSGNHIIFSALSPGQVGTAPTAPLVSFWGQVPLTSLGSADHFPSTNGTSDLPTTYCSLAVISPIRLGLASF